MRREKKEGRKREKRIGKKRRGGEERGREGMETFYVLTLLSTCGWASGDTYATFAVKDSDFALCH